jgi:hypothetical protein
MSSRNKFRFLDALIRFSLMAIAVTFRRGSNKG